MKRAGLRAIVLLAAAVPAASSAQLRGGSRPQGLLALDQQHGRGNATGADGTFPPPAFYHTSKQLQEEIYNLATRCPGMKLSSTSGKGDDGRNVTLDVLTFSSTGGQAPVNRNFILFGEHARELISAESGLHFVKTLCGETGLAEQAKKVLQQNEFQIVVNANPDARVLVEQGHQCRRTNINKVDLNRNWDAHWQPSTPTTQEENYPGRRPFSESETVVVKQLLEAYKPTTFLSIHSGTKGMYMPWAFAMGKMADKNMEAMRDILKAVDGNHCKCPFGAAADELQYDAPGTSLDWVYSKLGTPYALLYEIYTSPEYVYSEHLTARYEEKLWREQQVAKQVAESSTPARNMLLQADLEKNFYACFPLFNPLQEQEFREVLDNWSAAYLETATQVVGKIVGTPAPR